jgi:hypothetical protein
VSRVPLDPPPAIALAGVRVASETLVCLAGADVLVLSTTLRDQALGLHSVYTGHPGAPTQIVHLGLAPRRTPTNDATAVSEHQMPVVHARRRCLYDHLQRLQDLAAETLACDAKVDIDDRTLEALEAPPPQARSLA